MILETLKALGVTLTYLKTSHIFIDGLTGTFVGGVMTNPVPRVNCVRLGPRVANIN